MKLVYTLYLVLQLFSNQVLSCMFNSDSKPGSNLRKYKRIETPTCSCGFDNFYEDPFQRSLFSKPWNVFIHLKNTKDPLIKNVCLGTIVAHNLIATSAKCLTLKSKKINIYDAWRSKHTMKNVAKARDLNVMTTMDEYHPNGLNIKIDRVIYHPLYIDSVINNRFPEADIALLVINKADAGNLQILDGIQDCGDPCLLHQPICLPTIEEAEGFLYQYAYYYGVGGADTDPSKEITGSGRTIILPGSDCDINMNSGITASEDSVCVKFRLPPPEVEGGPLVVNSDDDNNTAYLAGLASWVGNRHMFPLHGNKYAYFSHIKCRTL